MCLIKPPWIKCFTPNAILLGRFPMHVHIGQCRLGFLSTRYFKSRTSTFMSVCCCCYYSCFWTSHSYLNLSNFMLFDINLYKKLVRYCKLMFFVNIVYVYKYLNNENFWKNKSNFIAVIILVQNSTFTAIQDIIASLQVLTLLFYCIETFTIAIIFGKQLQDLRFVFHFHIWNICMYVIVNTILSSLWFLYTKQCSIASMM